MRRRELLQTLLLTLPAAALATTALAAPPEAEQAENLYHDATRLLLQGRKFELAAQMLGQAEMLLPEDYRFPAARGCALVSRAASLAYAAGFSESLAQMRTAYPAELAAWEAGHKDPESDYYEEPRPQLIPDHVFQIKDDGQPFRLSKKEVRERLAALQKQARASFEKAEQLAKTPEEKGEVAYLFGWGLSLLRVYGGGAGAAAILSEGGDLSENTDVFYPLPAGKEMITLFTKARDAAPENPLYWRSLAEHLHRGSSNEESEAAFLKAAELSPRDAKLWFLMYSLETNKGTSEAEAESPKKIEPDREKALNYLRRGQKADPSNAWLFYEEAGQHFKRSKYSLFTTPPSATTPETIARDEKNTKQWYGTLKEQTSRDAGKQALAAAEAGNAAGNCFLPVYEPAVPKLLRVAWGYNSWLNQLSDLGFGHYSRLRELARALSGYALFTVQEGNEQEAVRSCRASIRIGQRLEGEWTVKESSPGDLRIMMGLVGHAIVAIGLKMLIAVEGIAGNSQGSQAAQAEYDAFQVQVKAHKEAISKEIEKNSLNPAVMY
jgi:hypothetical protein